MTDNSERIDTFLSRFKCVHDFIQYCELNGIKGVPRDPDGCLIVHALEKKFGFPATVEHGKATVDGLGSVKLPSTMARLVQLFDKGHFPDLEE